MRHLFLIVSVLLLHPAHGLAAENASRQPSVPVREIPSFIQDVFTDLWAGFIQYLPYVVTAFCIILLCAIAASAVSRASARALARSGLRRSLQSLMVRFIRFGFWAAGFLIAAVIVFPNLTPTKVLGGLGVVSVAMGLIFKEFFENFFAGILILWRFPMDVGDVIECKDILGRIEEISVRMTLIRQLSDELVLVPNTFLTSNPVRVLTNLPARRVQAIVNVGYATPVSEAVRVIAEAVRSAPSVDASHPVEVFATELSPSSVDIEVSWWTPAPPLEIRRSRGEVLAAVKEALDAAGIEMPTPYATVVFKNRLAVDAAIADAEHGKTSSGDDA